MIEQILKPYRNAGYPAVAIETPEECRVITDCVKEWPRVFRISTVGGLRNEKSEKVQDATFNFAKAFQFVATQQDSILIVLDFQHMINAPLGYRPLLDVLPRCKSMGSLIVLVAPAWKLPPELRYEMPVVQIPLPGEDDFDIPLNNTQFNGKPSHRKALKSAARGLTLAQAENVFAMSGLDFTYDKNLVETEKMRLVKSGYMNVEKRCDPENLAGLGLLKSYVTEEVLPSRDDEQLRVRGLLLVGVPGTGKSLSAKVIASLLDWPLVRLDISAAKGSLVGQSESNLRTALSVADAVSPCIVWLDEIEKAVSGHASSAITDGGTTLAMVGTLLTWMQEHTSPVVIVATCNDYSKLPVEMTRPGRFDERFFLDLPTPHERDEIAKVHLKRLGCQVEFSGAISDLTQDWTGAEIEQLIKSTARRTKRNIHLKTLEECASEINPISKTSDIQKLRDWARTNLRRANDLEIVATGRKMKGK